MKMWIIDVAEHQVEVARFQRNVVVSYNMLVLTRKSKDGLTKEG